jgi:DNA polymerase III subunit beta
MAHQDVRYYLNGLLLEISPQGLRAVATDGHRLAVADLEVEGSTGVEEPRSIIIPRKAVGELQRVLATEGEAVEFAMGSNAIQVTLPSFRLTSKLIDGKFPDYERVIPRVEECDKRVLADREELRQGLSRAAILSNDKYRAVRLSLSPGLLRLVANNPEQEEAEDEVEVEYEGESVEIGFNVAYLIDALNALPGERACIHLMDAGSSALITPEVGEACRYVVMPMRL